MNVRKPVKDMSCEHVISCLMNCVCVCKTRTF